MRNTLLVCLALSLSAMAGCGSNATVTSIPESVSQEEIDELDADERRVEQEERQHQRAQRQQRRAR